jgi:hypothetical protein
MSTDTHRPPAHVAETKRETTKRGDVIVVAGDRVGEPKQTGEILEVLGEPDHRRYRVQWDDGQESGPPGDHCRPS